MFEPGTENTMKRGFVEAEQDDDVAFFLDLRRTIETHALVKTTTQAHFDLNL